MENPPASAFDQALLEATEQEQEKLAQLLHDTVCQSIVGIHLFARVISRKFAHACPEAADDFAQFDALLHRATDDVHELVKSLRTVAIDPGELFPALTEFASTVSKRVACDFFCTRDQPPIHEPGVARQVYLIVREAVGDALSRGGVTQISIRLSLAGTHYSLAIDDDGIVPAQLLADSADSLVILASRARTLRGAIERKRRPAGGTTVECRFPVSVV